MQEHSTTFFYHKTHRTFKIKCKTLIKLLSFVHFYGQILQAIINFRCFNHELMNNKNRFPADFALAKKNSSNFNSPLFLYTRNKTLFYKWIRKSGHKKIKIENFHKNRNTLVHIYIYLFRIKRFYWNSIMRLFDFLSDT